MGEEVVDAQKVEKKILIQNFSQEIKGKKLMPLAYMWVIFKWILRITFLRAWSGFIWLRIRTSSGPLSTQQ
jgi:hypothetical protein